MIKTRDRAWAEAVAGRPAGPVLLRENYGFSRRIIDRIRTAAATQRAAQRRRIEPTATEARYDRRRARFVINLNNGLGLAFPPHVAEGLEKATPAELSDIEISPSGFGIHFPKLDAHLYLPALLQGVFGSKKWMAAQFGAAIGMARTTAKRTAARANGRRGGRPRKLGAR